jgi:hypothetical protein
MALLDAAHGARREELPAAIPRLLGFTTTTTATLREIVERQVEKPERKGEIGEANRLLQRA